MMPRVKFDRALLPDRPDLNFETNLWNKGISLVAGIDEAGRGALAGPVAVGVVIFPKAETDLMARLSGIRDSKVMQHAEREHWAKEIRALALTWGVGMAEPEEIDRVGIAPATYLAAARALEALEVSPEHLLVDYIKLPNTDLPQTSLVKGDARSLSIAAAAIMAKTTRDALLVDLEQVYPGYGFSRNKGYATRTHRQAIVEMGPCAAHRRSFAPVSEFDSLFPPDIAS